MASLPDRANLEGIVPGLVKGTALQHWRLAIYLGPVSDVAGTFERFMELW